MKYRYLLLTSLCPAMTICSENQQSTHLQPPTIINEQFDSKNNEESFPSVLRSSPEPEPNAPENTPLDSDLPSRVSPSEQDKLENASNAESDAEVDNNEDQNMTDSNSISSRCIEHDKMNCSDTKCQPPDIYAHPVFDENALKNALQALNTLSCAELLPITSDDIEEEETTENDTQKTKSEHITPINPENYSLSFIEDQPSAVDHTADNVTNAAQDEPITATDTTQTDDLESRSVYVSASQSPSPEQPLSPRTQNNQLPQAPLSPAIQNIDSHLLRFETYQKSITRPNIVTQKNTGHSLFHIAHGAATAFAIQEGFKLLLPAYRSESSLPLIVGITTGITVGALGMYLFVQKGIHIIMSYKETITKLSKELSSINIDAYAIKGNLQELKNHIDSIDQHNEPLHNQTILTLNHLNDDIQNLKTAFNITIETLKTHEENLTKLNKKIITSDQLITIQEQLNELSNAFISQSLENTPNIDSLAQQAHKMQVDISQFCLTIPPSFDEADHMEQHAIPAKKHTSWFKNPFSRTQRQTSTV